MTRERATNYAEPYARDTDQRYLAKRRELVDLIERLKKQVRTLDWQYTGLSDMPWPRPERLIGDSAK